MSRYRVDWKNVVGILYWMLIVAITRLLKKDGSSLDDILIGALLQALVLQMLVVLLHGIYKLLRLENDGYRN